MPSKPIILGKLRERVLVHDGFIFKDPTDPLTSDQLSGQKTLTSAKIAPLPGSSCSSCSSWRDTLSGAMLVQGRITVFVIDCRCCMQADDLDHDVPNQTLVFSRTKCQEQPLFSWCLFSPPWWSLWWHWRQHAIPTFLPFPRAPGLQLRLD